MPRARRHFRRRLSPPTQEGRTRAKNPSRSPHRNPPMWWQPSKRPHLKLSKRLGVVQSARGATPPPSKPDTDRRLPRAGSWRSFKTSRPTSTTPRLQVHRRRAKAPSPSGARARALLVLGVALRCEGGPGRARGGALLAPGVASPCLLLVWRLQTGAQRPEAPCPTPPGEAAARAARPL